MATEITLSVSFIVTPLYSNFPRRRVDDFAIELEKLLKVKISPYWFPDQPFSGMHQRCLRVNGTYADQIMYYAASKAGINYSEMQSLFPKEELKIWIDPGEVSYQIGELNEIKYLLKRNYQHENNISAGMSSENGNSNAKNSSVPYFTVSSFAKTKFGSTKLKHSNGNTDSARPNSLKINNKQTDSLPYTPESCSSGMMSPNNLGSVNSPETSTINIPCCVPWCVDSNTNTLNNLLTINIPTFHSTGRESSENGSITSELNSPIYGY